MSDSSLPPGAPPRDATGVLVRRATVADRDAVRALVPALGREEPEPRAFDASFGPLLAALDTYLAVAELPHAGVVGYVLANRHLSLAENGAVCRVEEVAVDPAHRRGGLGRALLDAAETWAAEAGARRVGIVAGRCRELALATGHERTAEYFSRTLTPHQDGGGAGPDAAAWDGPVLPDGARA
ncbi:GNAT family N-acetyltransferase [Cellulosimicrobium marinum]|uniref:GNAT family N-acetyltransferase n=1 Tax=Cellulosimicrobium marinum TaxID=1638992 RepID=UPI001E2D9666|nr:GNAT family N-acetyltransferase [Cellulosimicrobium marinum]MCB7138176.1 GNAT family N-acetyltransferase [Cellulosimicrobium marinum]